MTVVVLYASGVARKQRDGKGRGNHKDLELVYLRKQIFLNK